MTNDKQLQLECERSEIHRLITGWLMNEQLEDVLMGNGNCDSGDPSSPISVSPILIIDSLHTLILEGWISNGQVNRVFRKIHITQNNICILLNYICKYILYKKNKYSVVDLNASNILHRIHDLHGLYSDLVCVQNMWKIIWDELADDRPREALGVDPALREIDSRP